MADSATTIFGFVLPEVGASEDTWGSKWNQNLQFIDYVFGAHATSGSSNAYTLTSGFSVASYVTGASLLLIPNFTNSGAATFNLDGLGAKAITKNGTTALASGDLVSGQAYRLAYDGTQWQIVGLVSQTANDATIQALAALAWSSGTPLLQFTAADTVSLTLSPAVQGLTVSKSQAGNTFANIVNTLTDAAALAYVQMTTDAGVAALGLGSTLNASGNGFAFLNLPGAFRANPVGDTTWQRNSVTKLTIGSAAVTLGSGEDLVLDGGAPTSTKSAGFRSAGPSNVKTADYTTAATDEGNALDMNSGSAHAITIKASTHSANAELFGVNMGAGVLTLTRDTGVTFRDGTGTNANLTVNQYQQWYARRDPSTDNLWYVRVS